MLVIRANTCSCAFEYIIVVLDTVLKDVSLNVPLHKRMNSIKLDASLCPHNPLMNQLETSCCTVSV